MPSAEIKPIIGFQSDTLLRHLLVQPGVKHSVPFRLGPGITPGEGGGNNWFGGDTATVLAPPVQYIDY